jgi:hypothetical protein
MYIDKNKKIDWISYNYLNLPGGITIRDKSNITNTIIYKYDAAGNKIQKEVYPGAVPPGKITTYLGAWYTRIMYYNFYRRKKAVLDLNQQWDLHFPASNMIIC